MNNANIAAQLFETAARHPGRHAVRHLDTGQTLTYQQLSEQASRIATGFRDVLGLTPGDRVALLLDNSPTYLEVFFGALAAGLVVVPLNTRLAAADFGHMISDSGARALVSQNRFRPILAELAAVVPPLIGIHGDGPGLPLAALKSGDGSRPLTRADDDICSLMYTSGTTGSPKAVMLSHRAWSSVADTIPTLMPVDSDTRVLHAAPLTHGAGFLVLPTLRAGGLNLTCEGYQPVETARLIAEGEVHGLFMVPSMIRMLLDVLPPDWTPADSFRWLYYAGSPIGLETLREAAERFDARMVQSFAQMEAPMFLTSLGPDGHREARDNPGSDIGRTAGTVIEGREIRLIDSTGAPVTDGAVGEIIARSPQTMLGYWGREADTSRTIRDGWLHTGDLGRFDEHERLHVVDRVKDMIVSGGSNIYAREVEEAIEGAPGVAECAVIGLPHRIWGEQVTAVVVAAADEHVDEDGVRAFCRDRLAGYKVPKRVITVPELPRNPYGKVLKRDLRLQLS